jgi:hypothetical protein
METEQEKILPFAPTHVSTIPIAAADELLATVSLDDSDLQEAKLGSDMRAFSEGATPASPVGDIGSDAGGGTVSLTEAMRDFGGGVTGRGR